MFKSLLSYVTRTIELLIFFFKKKINIRETTFFKFFIFWDNLIVIIERG